MQQQPRLFMDKQGNLHSFKHIPQLFSFGCTLLLILSIVAACGGSTPGSSTGNSNGKITLTEMDYWSVPAQGATLNKLFGQYQKLHPNIVIQRNAVPFANLLPKADQEAASHTLPDIMALDNPDVAQFAATGALTPLDSYMQGNFNASDFYAGPLTTMKYQSKTYSIPVGNNDLALYYNKKAFTAAKLQPPTTWSQLEADAKALTHGNTYGFAFSAPANEQATFQFEPFLWSNNGDLSKIDSSTSVAALQVLVNMIQQGSASKGALNWGQVDVATQFGEGNAAIMENGPWELPALEQQYKMKFGVDFGVVPMPVPQTGAAPVVPLGGEAWTIPVNRNPAVTKASWDLVNWLEQPDQLRQLDEGFGYIPALKSTAQLVLKDNPELQVFADEFNTARARTAQLGTKYPKVSQAIWTAEQAALTGGSSSQAALTQAQQQIATILNS
ncbi:ABC transporter substrate-binding protein [Dictyobacter arantiisoli]|uniref:Sugar ABC transporter substrate-binding protein n=1 Tax=Dictyobacter arantiisoli TaxID=2014874 RepID=A0A5A5TEE8_9CHLR|nr:extracellular solute-binding protein [Dictyobacter arantiisoli]GCF09792.1 sugar ABC transporter substrate-binding protein [Dictyobacter arantiisoli]